MTKLVDMCELILDTITKWTVKLVDVLKTDVGDLVDDYLDGIVENIADLMIPNVILDNPLYIVLFSTGIFIFIVASMVGIIKKLFPLG